MLEYVIKSGVCLFILHLFYVIFLEAEKVHTFKRIYLLSILLISLILPFLSFSYYAEAETVIGGQQIIYASENASEIVEQTNSLDYLISLLWLVYALGVVCFTFRFFKNLSRLNRSIEKHEKIASPNSIKVLLPFKTIPYSYFRYIFLSKESFKKNQIPLEVIKHEEAHVNQAHTVDLFILELLQIIFWFNPIFYFLKRSVRLNHEFLADEVVLNDHADPVNYSNLIIDSSREDHQFPLTSPFKHSLIKKRIIMMSNQFSRKGFISKIALLIPVLCLCIYFFNNEIVAKTKLTPKVEFGLSNKISDEKSTSPNSTEPLKLISPLQTETEFQESGIQIRIEGETIFLNGKQVDLKDFARELNTYTDKISDAELKNKNLKIQVRNVPEGFQKKIDNEFKKTRFFKLNPNKHGLVPPPPPAPPKNNGEVPEPPKAPEKVEIIEERETPKAPEEPIVIEVRDTPKAPEEPVIIKVIEDKVLSTFKAKEKRQKLEKQRMRKQAARLKHREKQLELREKQLEKRNLEFEKRKKALLEKRENKKVD